MMSSRLSDLLKRNTFPSEPLDEIDRKIIEASYKHGREGVGFNRFVDELKPSVSRSTVAFRVERLCKLGYLERISNSLPGNMKPVRVSFKCFSLLSMLDQLRSKAAKLALSIREEGSI
jgi:DNA-binding Lrp family transcriptional regulator